MVIFPLAPDQTIAQMWSNGARGGGEDDLELHKLDLLCVIISYETSESFEPSFNKKAMLSQGKPCDAAVIFQDGGRLPSRI